MPITRSGRLTAWASWVTGIEDVFEATIVCSPMTSPIAVITSSFRRSFSGTASTTRPAPAISESSVVSVIRPSTAVASSADSLPRLTARESDCAIRSRARSTAARSTSRTTTGTPATATASAMPEPMNPAPTTATDSILVIAGQAR